MINSAYSTLFFAFMDYVVRPITWMCSPKFRSHMRVVHAQNAYLDNRDNPDLTENQKLALKLEWFAQAERDDLLHRQKSQ